jgi:TonB-linked SusC/RagA family outer membrane protein
MKKLTNCFRVDSFDLSGVKRFSILLLPLFFLMLMPFFGHAQQIRVTGTVMDAKGEPQGGVSISVKGTVLATSTDEAGKYTIAVSNADAVLVFSSVGFNPKEEKVGTRRSINVVLENATSNLDDVVVIGYGTQKKRDVTGAISSVNAKQIEERQPIDVLDALQGQIPGMQIATESGRPGAGGSVRIRGIGTIEGGADPLYIVDGAQGVDINGINPNDIESVEVLRDAASAAIYGSRSANGVVIITTKRGKEGKPALDLRYLTSWSTLANKLPQATAAQRRTLERFRGSAVPGDSLNPSFNSDNDYQDLLSRTARRQQVDFSISGASKNMNYYGSLGYLADEGIIINSWSNILRGRFNMEYKASKKVTFGNRFQISYQTENRIDEGRTLTQALQRPPTFRIFFPDGSLTGVIGGRRNPVAEALLNKNEFDIARASMYTYMNYQINKDLRFTVDANITANYQHNLRFLPKLTSNTGIDNELTDATNWNTYWMLQAFLNYDKKIGKDHQFNAVLGVSADNDFRRAFSLRGIQLASEAILTLNSPQAFGLPDNEEARRRSASAFGRLGYSYKGKYLINSNFRADGASAFGVDNRWGFFPSVSAGWRFSDESFMQWTSKVLTDGKIRVSYGVTGNDRIPAYDALSRYGLGNFYNGVGGIAPLSQFGNNVLSWEELVQTNYGIDLTFLQGRLTFSADLYNKLTKGLLYNAPLPAETGFDNVRVNVGSIRNRGLELVLSGYPIRNKNFSWNAVYNMSFNNATVEELYEGISILEQFNRTEVGKRIGEFYGYRALGVYAFDESNAYDDNWNRLFPVLGADGMPTGSYVDANGRAYTGNIQQAKILGNVSKGGDMIWQDTDRNGVIDDADRIDLGNAQPKWIAGITNFFNYKQFGLSVGFYGSYGGKIYNQFRAVLNRNTVTNVTNDPEYIDNFWRRPGDVTIWPVARNNGMNNQQELSSLYLEDASFIRLRNVRFTYSLPRSIAQKAKMRGVTVYVYGNNLVTWTNYKGYDPEIAFNNPLTMGIDNGRYPRRREVGAGLNLNF